MTSETPGTDLRREEAVEDENALKAGLGWPATTDRSRSAVPASSDLAPGGRAAWPLIVPEKRSRAEIMRRARAAPHGTGTFGTQPAHHIDVVHATIAEVQRRVGAGVDLVP